MNIHNVKDWLVLSAGIYEDILNVAETINSDLGLGDTIKITRMRVRLSKPLLSVSDSFDKGTFIIVDYNFEQEESSFNLYL